MDGGVVELHPLADADGAGAQDDDLLVGGDNGLVLVLIGGVEVGHIAVKLAGAGVDHLVHREDAQLPALVVHLPLRALPQPGQGLVGEALALGLAQHVRVPGPGLELLLVADDVADLV